jgi:hypothetical protein
MITAQLVRVLAENVRSSANPVSGDLMDRQLALQILATTLEKIELALYRSKADMQTWS